MKKNAEDEVQHEKQKRGKCECGSQKPENEA